MEWIFIVFVLLVAAIVAYVFLDVQWRTSAVKSGASPPDVDTKSNQNLVDDEL